MLSISRRLAPDEILPLAGTCLRLVRWSGPGVSFLASLVLALLLFKLLDLAFIELNRRLVVLPQFDVTLIPYHDPRVTKRAASLLRYHRPPQIVFAGDSRTKNGFDPEVIGEALAAPTETFFNFGTGSQVVRFAREAFLPLLLDLGVRPQYLVFGVSPDWLLKKQRLWELIDKYRQSQAYRIRHPDPNGDAVEEVLSQFLVRHLALYRYRADVIHQELVPNLKCWFFADCYTTPYRDVALPFKEAERIAGLQTRYGWHPDLWSEYTSGEYWSTGGRRRFTEEDEVDVENLSRLIVEVRGAGMIPLFVVMPVHPSFRQVHEPAMSRNQVLLEQIAEEHGVDILVPQGDYKDQTLFVDGHHLSPKGAAYFSVDIARALEPYVQATRRGGG